MKVSICPQEKEENRQHTAMANNQLSLIQALRGNCPKKIAKALHKFELSKRTESRFKYAIEWAILGEDKIEFWQQVKQHYYS